jgi:hypothetical protein
MTDGSILKDMGSYKSTLLSYFVNSEEICELLFDKETYTEEDGDNLIYTQIFPYLYTDETQTKVLPYICVEVDVPRIPTHTIKDMKLIIWVYCHKNGMKYSKKGYSGTKVDILADMVERVLRNSDRFGVGKLQLQSVTYFFPNAKYYGKQLIYTVPDFKVR